MSYHKYLILCAVWKHIIFRFIHRTVTARATEKTLIMEPTRPFSSRWLLTFKIFLFQQIYKFSTHIVKLIRNHSQFHLSISDDLVLHLFQALLWSFKKETFGLLSQFAFVSGLDSGLSCSCCSFSSKTDISGRPV